MSSTLFRTYCTLVLAFVAASTATAQSQGGNPAVFAPLGLTRLARNGDADAAVPSSKFEIDALEAPREARGIARKQQGGLGYLEIGPLQTWSKKLSQSEAKARFVSLVVTAGEGTEIVIGDARIAVSSSEREGFVEILLGGGTARSTEPALSAGYHVPLEEFQGRPLAMLPLLTVRLDSESGVWDLYTSRFPLREGMKIPSGKSGKGIEIKAGPAGALLSGVVVSDENPLFDDVDRNGVDDAFERERGRKERGEMVSEWKGRLKEEPPQVTYFARPLPDRSLNGGQ